MRRIMEQMKNRVAKQQDVESHNNVGQPSDTQPVTFSLVIPALNEENGIANILDRVLAIQPKLTEVGVSVLELIVVDDGSSDRTAEIVRSYLHECSQSIQYSQNNVRLVQHPKNRGYGAALKSGFRAASGQLLGFLDADGTYPPEYFPRLCQSALQGADVVIGSRRSGASSEMPFVRRMGNFLWSGLLTIIAGQRVVDPASGMRVFRREALERLYPLPDGLNFTPVMSTRSAHEKMQVLELPIPYQERVGRSKLNVVRDGMRFLQTILWTALTYNPVRILGGLGSILFFIAGMFALVLIGMRLSGITVLGPWGVAGSFAAVVLGIAGVDLFALGVTFNYLVSLFHKRPIRQGLFGRPIFKTPLDRHFWWMGLLLMLTGAVLGLASFILGINGWQIERLWLYLLAGTMFLLVGLQLVVFWVIVRILDELSQRENKIRNDLSARDQED
jgi:glycosyltransferase involved in cell wall biosynthesis